MRNSIIYLTPSSAVPRTDVFGSFHNSLFAYLFETVRLVVLIRILSQQIYLLRHRSRP